MILTVGATKTEKDTAESSAAASKFNVFFWKILTHNYTGLQTLPPNSPGATTAPGSSSCHWTSTTYR